MNLKIYRIRVYYMKTTHKMTTIQRIITEALQNAGPLSFFIVFWTGAVLSLGSCTIIRVPIIIGYVGGKSESKKKAILLTSFFVLGLALSYTLLGILFGIIGGLTVKMVAWSRYIYYFVGTLAFAIGLSMTGIIRTGRSTSPCCEVRGKTAPAQKGLIGAFLFGLTFAIFEAPVCPCCAPALLIIGGLTLAKGDILYGIFMFFAYALGQGFPTLLIGSFTGIMKYISPKLERAEPVIRFAAGNILLALAAFLFLAG